MHGEAQSGPQSYLVPHFQTSTDGYDRLPHILSTLEQYLTITGLMNLRLQRKLNEIEPFTR